MGCESVSLANCTHAVSACCIPAEQQQTAACNCFSRCAAPDTPIATPSGERAIATLEPGDLVYSVVGAEVRAVPIRRIQRVEVHDHEMVRVVLSDGGVLEISPGHPTADGRVFGDLGAGDSLDGMTIAKIARVRISKDATYDILPDSDTGTYFAGGVLIGSTLAPAMPRLPPAR